jgi:hypothetical protein
LETDVYKIGIRFLMMPNWLMNKIESSRMFGFVLRQDGYITNPSLGSGVSMAAQAALSRISSVLPTTNSSNNSNNLSSITSHFTPTVATLGSRSSPSLNSGHVSLDIQNNNNNNQSNSNQTPNKTSSPKPPSLT